MAARGSKNAQARTSAERVRLHAARTKWHEQQIRRRVRDNTVAAIICGLIVIAAIGSQVLHAQNTAPEPTPSPTIEPMPTVEPTTGVSETPEPVPSATPTE